MADNKEKKRRRSASRSNNVERIEIHVRRGFTAQIDNVARSLGIGRMSYIRNLLYQKVQEHTATAS